MEEEQKRTKKTEETEKGFQQVNRKKKNAKEGTKVQMQTKTMTIESK